MASINARAAPTPLVSRANVTLLEMKKANHAKVDWRKTAYCTLSSAQRGFWWFALPERTAQLVRKTRILTAKFAGD
jgi:hypothetical protein